MTVEPVPLVFAVIAAGGTVVILSVFFEGVPSWLLLGGAMFNGVGMYVVQRGIVADQRLRDFQEEGREWTD